MEGVLPSRLWQPDKSRSRRDAAKARMAACVSMALQRWIKALVKEWRRRAGAWRALVCAASSLPTSSNFNPKNNRASLRARVSRETKVNKACDESGLAAELLQHAPDEFLVELLHLSNGILQHGSAPAGWKKTIVHDASQKDSRKTGNGLPPHCQHTASLQGVCLHDPRASGAVIGKFSAKGTTWFSFRPKNGRTCVDNESCFG